MRIRIAAAALATPVLLAAVGGCASSGGYAEDPPPPSYAPAGAQQPHNPLSRLPSSTSTPAQAPPTSAPKPVAASTFNGLKPGDSGDKVRQLQQRLQQLGFWVGTPDGNYGLTTTQAVMAVQKAGGLSRDGVVGDRTRDLLARGVSVSAQSTSGHVIEINKAKQLLLLVENGHVQEILNTSTGTEAPYSYKGHSGVANTPPGHFAVNRKVDGEDDGPLGDLFRPMYFNGGIAVHGAPDIPGYPASHGCARVSNPAINWIWASGWGGMGTPVWVY